MHAVLLFVAHVELDINVARIYTRPIYDKIRATFVRKNNG